MAERVVLASGNPGKIREIADILRPLGHEVVPQSELGIEDAEETGLSYVENAIIKARNASLHSGLAAIADDSGLDVDALNGAPGIHSARFSGADANSVKNVEKLLRKLDSVEQTGRTARFRCVIVAMKRADDPSPFICEGTWEGRISLVPAGDGGFGYDPVFIPQGMDISAAELDPAEKNRISHRGQALSLLRRRWL